MSEPLRIPAVKPTPQNMVNFRLGSMTDYAELWGVAVSRATQHLAVMGAKCDGLTVLRLP